MKFSQSLKINVIPDWSDNYIAYSSLKKTIYQLEKDLQNLNDKNDVEQPLLNQVGDINDDDDLYVNPTCKLFGNLLINEIERITKFYKEKEIEFYTESQNLFNSISKIENSSSSRFRFNASDSNSDNDDDVNDDDDDDPRDNSDSDDDDDHHFNNTSNNLYINPQEFNDHNRHETDIREAHYKTGVNHNRSKTTVVDKTPSRNRRRSSNDEPPRRKSISVIRRPSLGLLKRFRSNSFNENDFDESIWNSKSNFAIDQRIMIKKRLTELFVQFSELKQYIDINQTGFKKILKKFDKITENDLQSKFMNDVVLLSYPFTQVTKQRLDNMLLDFIHTYAKVVTLNNEDVARSQLQARE